MARGEALPRIAHEAQLVQLAAEREEHREPDERREHVAFLRDVSRRQHAGRQKTAETEKRDGRRIEAERRRRRPRARPCRTKTTATIHSSRVSGPSARERRAGRRRRLRRRRHLWPHHAIQHAAEGATIARASAPTRRAASARTRSRRRRPRAISVPSGLAAIAVSQSADDRLRLAMPENIRKAPRRRASRLAGSGARGARQRVRERIEHARPRGVARKRRRDHRVHEEDGVRQARASIVRSDSRPSDRRASPSPHSPRRAPPGTRRR